MKLYRTISGVILFFSSSVFAQVVLNTKAEKALSEIMKAQEFYWNKGDIEGFMEGYWNNTELVFVGKIDLLMVLKTPWKIIKKAIPTIPPQNGSIFLNRNGSFLYKNNQPLAQKDSFAYSLKTVKGYSDNIWVQLERAAVDSGELN